jgi:hypothetical protein
MRSLLSSLFAAGLLGLSLGCCHTAGVCDCDMPHGHCSAPPLVASPTAAPVAAPTVTTKPEALKDLPKDVIKSSEPK